MSRTYDGQTDEDFYVDIIMTAPPADIAAATEIAKSFGRLIWRSAPKPMGGTDKRHQVAFRLDSNLY